MGPPRVVDHFARAGLFAILRRGHPYDALETYEVLEAVYGYRAAYVNYGFWPEGAATEESGRRLALLAAHALDLRAGERLFEAGSGLGQAAVDLAARHDLASVLGVNTNARQVAYANALAASAGLAGRVRHEVGEAAAFIAGLAPGSFDGVLAIECVSHFADPDAFLAGARRALRPGGRIALTTNIARRPAARWERALFRASFGFVPVAGEVWAERLARAGFAAIARRDLTRETIGTLAEVCLARLGAPTQAVRRIPWPARAWLGLLFRSARRAVRRGALGYELVVAETPGPGV